MLKIFSGLVVFILSVNIAFSSPNDALTEWKQNLSELLESNSTKQIGTAKFSVFIWDIYQSQLSTSSGNYPDPEGLIVYQIKYFKNIESKELIKKTIEQWQHLGIKSDRYTPYVKQLGNIWPDIEEDDQLAFVAKGDKSAFYYNGDLVGSIDNQGFAEVFLSIWFSEKTSQPELRDSLLGIKS